MTDHVHPFRIGSGLNDQYNLDDTSEALYDDAEALHQAARILRERFRTGKHNETAAAVRRAEAELISRARHPSRQKSP
jgi:hypothetical protein